MKKFAVLLILVLSLFMCGCTDKKEQTTLDRIKERDSLIAGVKFETKPFGYIENNELKGFDIDIVKKIAKNILGDENKIEFIEVNSENRISKLAGEEVDIIVATMTDTQERREIVDFSVPYYISGQAVLCKKGTEVTSIADLSNHNTVIVSGTTAEKTLKQIYKRSNIIKALTYNEAFRNVNNTTCMIADEAILRGYVLDNPDYFIYNKKLSVEPYAVAIRKDDAMLKQYVNRTISNLKDSGELTEIQKKWIK